MLFGEHFRNQSPSSSSFFSLEEEYLCDIESKGCHNFPKVTFMYLELEKAMGDLAY